MAKKNETAAAAVEEVVTEENETAAAEPVKTMSAKELAKATMGLKAELKADPTNEDLSQKKADLLDEHTKALKHGDLSSVDAEFVSKQKKLFAAFKG